MLDFFKNAIAELKGDRDRETSPDAPQKFVIFAVPRTGSNFLCKALDSHPEVLCHPELFHPENIYYSGSYLKNGGEKLGKVQIRDWFPKSFINQIWKQNFDCKAVGFKLMVWQNKKAFDLVLKNKDIKKILLLRRNKLKSYVSEKVAKKKKVWSAPESKPDKQKQGVSVAPEYLQSNLKKQNPQKLSQLVKNFPELEAALKGTELEPYLYAPDF